MISALNAPKRTPGAGFGTLQGRERGDARVRRPVDSAPPSSTPDARPIPSATRPTGRLALLAGLALAASSLFNPRGALADSEFCIPEEPADYRMSEFRTAVPCTLAGAKVVSTEDLRRLLEELSPVLVDVLPSPRRPEGLSEDAIWQPPARSNIPGSVWLPNTGFGVLPLEEEAYLRANLARLTAGDASRPIVFYCLADCWMSWNAARRAMEWGYASVLWYPHGTDGWKDAGLPLAESSPVPREAGQ